MRVAAVQCWVAIPWMIARALARGVAGSINACATGGTARRRLSQEAYCRGEVERELLCERGTAIAGEDAVIAQHAFAGDALSEGQHFACGDRQCSRKREIDQEKRCSS